MSLEIWSTIASVGTFVVIMARVSCARKYLTIDALNGIQDPSG